MPIQPDLSKLSARQHDVLRLLAKGLDDEAIATRLFISTRTVAGYKQKMVDTLGLNDVAELARVAARIFL